MVIISERIDFDYRTRRNIFYGGDGHPLIGLRMLSYRFILSRHFISITCCQSVLETGMGMNIQVVVFVSLNERLLGHQAISANIVSNATLTLHA
jgi:hypothetical protein